MNPLLRKILYGLLIVVIAIAGYYVYLSVTTRSHSPAETVNFSDDGVNITVDYCRPYKKGRLIFGLKEDGALQPFGQYWRLGANEATRFEVDQDIEFGGNQLKAGAYSLYAIPGPETWIIGVNREADRWGASPPDYDDDVFRLSVATQHDAPEQEQFKITINSDDAGGAVMLLHWDQTQVSVPIKWLD